MLVYRKYECFVMQMVCVLCAYRGSFQCCILHDFVLSMYFRYQWSFRQNGRLNTVSCMLPIG